MKIGRTHLEDAVPLTVGEERSGYAHQIRDAIAAIRRGREGLMQLAIGGNAVGTDLNAPPGFSAKVAARIAELTGQPFVTGPWPGDAASAPPDLPPPDLPPPHLPPVRAGQPRRVLISGREAILAAARAHRPALDQPLPPAPSFDDHPTPDLLAAFARALERMGREMLPAVPDDPLAALRARIPGARIVCSTVPEVAGSRTPTPRTRPADLGDIEYGSVRAAFAVAETGSVCLADATPGINTLGCLPQHLIVLLDPADIVFNLHQAYRRPDRRERAYAVLHTGPSATAEGEGVLIHGAKGVCSLAVLALARR